MFRFSLYLLAGFLLLIGAHAGVCLWVQKATANSSDLFSELLAMNDEQERRNELDIRHRAFHNRLLEKEAVVEALIEGEMTLSEAVAQFRQAHGNDMDSLLPGATPDEKMLNNVLMWVRSLCRERCAHEAGDLLERLEMEKMEILTGEHLALNEMQ